MSNDRIYLPGESTSDRVLDVVEIPKEGGGVRFRITRYFSADGTRWVRHGPFAMYHDNGRVASEGEYLDGLKQGVWRDYYEDGQLAAMGCYHNGTEHGYWQFWTRDGREQSPTEYEHGVEVGQSAQPTARGPNGATDNSQG